MSNSPIGKNLIRKAIARRLDLLRTALIRDLLINSVFASHLVPRRLRRMALRAWRVELASNCDPFFGLRFASNKVTFGEGSSARDCFFDNTAARVTLGRNVRIGGNTAFLTRGHPIGTADRRNGYGDIDRPITVGDGTWIGYGVTVMGGVNIGAGCVIAAGALVAKDCAPNGIYAGVPAQRIRDLD